MLAYINKRKRVTYKVTNQAQTHNIEGNKKSWSDGCAEPDWDIKKGTPNLQDNEGGNMTMGKQTGQYNEDHVPQPETHYIFKQIVEGSATK